MTADELDVWEREATKFGIHPPWGLRTWADRCAQVIAALREVTAEREALREEVDHLRWAVDDTQRRLVLALALARDEGERNKRLMADRDILLRRRVAELAQDTAAVACCHCGVSIHHGFDGPCCDACLSQIAD